MRVLLIQAGFGAGGAEKIVAMIAGHRAALGDEVHVAGMNMPENGSYFDYPNGVTLHLLDDAQHAGRRPSPLRRLLAIRASMKRIEPELVVSFLTKVNVLSLLAARGLDVPVLVSERNNPRAQRVHPAWLHLERLVRGRAAGIVVLTDRGLATIPQRLRARARVIPNPCDPIPGAPAQPEETATRLVAVGRLDWQKGFDLLLQAFATVHERLPRTRLTIYGDGGERGSLEELRGQLGLDEVVSMPGVTESPGSWISQGHVLVVSSRHEGFCNVIAEATRSGVPVIAFDCDYGPREIIRPGVDGLLVPPGDIDGLADNIVQLLENGALRRQLAAAARATPNDLAPDRILGQWDAVIDAAQGAGT